MRAKMGSTMMSAGRVEEFNRAHPVTDAGTVPVIEDFDLVHGRAKDAIGQQIQSAQRSLDANRARGKVRDQLWRGLLRLFADFLAVGAEEVAELRGIKAPRKNISEVRFVAQAKAVIETMVSTVGPSRTTGARNGGATG